MPRKTTTLSNMEIAQAKPKEKEYNLSDGEGLMLRVKPTGSKLWIFNYYRPYSKKRASISMGSYPATSLKEAREKRRSARNLLEHDIDPQEARKEKIKTEQDKLNNTLIKIAERWFTLKKTKVTEDYATDIWRSLELHIFPKLGKLPIHLITAPDTISAIEPTAASGSLETVKRLCQRLNEIMIYSVNSGLIHHNPLTNIKDCFAAPKKQNMPTLRPEELPEFMETLKEASILRTTRRLIEWQLHTMARPSEAAGTTWEEINFEQKLWNIPPERMKKKRAHTVPLSLQALDILEKMKPISAHCEYVFPSDRAPMKHAHPYSANVAIKRMGFGGRLVAHGLRALASTTLNEQGFNGDLIEAALAHVEPNEVRRAYNRAEYIEQRQEMMEWWSKQIEGKK